MKLLLLIPALIIASNFGNVRIWDGTDTALVTTNNKLNVTTGSDTINIAGTDTLEITIIDTPVVKIQSSDSIQIWDGTTGPMEIDDITNALVQIDFEENQLHSGNHYYYISNQTKNSGDSVETLIVTPNTTTLAHVVFEATSSGESTFALFEGVTTSSDGAAQTEHQSNRNSGNTAAIVITDSPTLTGSGTLIFEHFLGSGQKTGGAARPEEEIILKQNTKYYARVISAAASNRITVHYIWYEHININ